MKTALLLTAAVGAALVAAADADAQSRNRARAGAAANVQATLPPTPYRLLGPGAVEADASVQAGATPATDDEDRAAPQGATPATPARPDEPTQGSGAAQPATPADPARPAGQDVQAGEDAGEATPERARAEAALRRVLAGLAAGTPNYDLMDEQTAARVRAQQPSLTPALKQYGAIRTITPLASADANQRFRVEFENGAATFVINAQTDGTITALGVEQ